jgi:hypothetical protein
MIMLGLSITEVRVMSDSVKFTFYDYAIQDRVMATAKLLGYTLQLNSHYLTRYEGHMNKEQYVSITGPNGQKILNLKVYSANIKAKDGVKVADIERKYFNHPHVIAHIGRTFGVTFTDVK